MIDKELEDLMHRELDGETTPAESARLRELLAANSEARTGQEELNALARTLGAVVPVEPDPAWKQELLVSLREHAGQARSEAPSRSSRTVVRPLRSWFAWRTASVFAAGLAAGIVVMLAIGDRWPGVDGSSVPGAMLRIDRLDAIATIDDRPLGLEGVRGRVRTRALPHAVLADIEIASDQPVEIRLSFDPEALSPQGWVQGIPDRGQIALQSGEVRITHRGENRYVVALHETRGAPAELHVQVRSGDRVAEEVLRTRPGGH